MPLPDEVAQLLSDVNADQTPHARALADIDGNLGETYAVGAADTLHLCSKRLGEGYRHVALPHAQISAIRVEHDRPFAYLHITAEAEYSLKFAGMDMEKLQAIRQTWAGDAAPASDDAGAGGQSAPSLKPDVADTAGQPADAPLVADPLLVFCAALQKLIRIDGSIDAEEMHLVHRALDNVELVARGIEYLQDHDDDALMADLQKHLAGNQKLCLVANLLEIAMADGYLRKEERQFIHQVCEAIGVQEDTYKAIYDVLIIKNNLSVLSARDES